MVNEQTFDELRKSNPIEEVDSYYTKPLDLRDTRNLLHTKPETPTTALQPLVTKKADLTTRTAIAAVLQAALGENALDFETVRRCIATASMQFLFELEDICACPNLNKVCDDLISGTFEFSKNYLIDDYEMVLQEYDKSLESYYTYSDDYLALHLEIQSDYANFLESLHTDLYEQVYNGYAETSNETTHIAKVILTNLAHLHTQDILRIFITEQLLATFSPDILAERTMQLPMYKTQTDYTETSLSFSDIETYDEQNLYTYESFSGNSIENL